MEKKPYIMRGMPDFLIGLENLIDHIRNNGTDPSELTIVEIGSYAGESSKVFAKHFKRVVCVDPWMENYGDDIVCQHAKLSEVEKLFDKNMEEFKNVTKLKMTSDEFFERLPKLKVAGKKLAFEVIYIDGLHTYEQVKKDIENSLSLNLKFIAGHDYSEYFPGVVSAVNEALGEPDKKFIDNSWIKKQ